MQAARDKKYAQLMTLIKEEAGVQSADGMTALMYAALFNNSLAINYLIDKEARLVDNDGNSALILQYTPISVVVQSYWLRTKGESSTM